MTERRPGARVALAAGGAGGGGRSGRSSRHSDRRGRRRRVGAATVGFNTPLFATCDGNTDVGCEGAGAPCVGAAGRRGARRHLQLFGRRGAGCLQLLLEVLELGLLQQLPRWHSSLIAPGAGSFTRPGLAACSQAWAEPARQPSPPACASSRLDPLRPPRFASGSRAAPPRLPAPLRPAASGGGRAASSPLWLLLLPPPRPRRHAACGRPPPWPPRAPPAFSRKADAADELRAESPSWASRGRSRTLPRRNWSSSAPTTAGWASARARARAPARCLRRRRSLGRCCRGIILSAIARVGAHAVATRADAAAVAHGAAGGSSSEMASAGAPDAIDDTLSATIISASSSWLLRRRRRRLGHPAGVAGRNRRSARSIPRCSARDASSDIGSGCWSIRVVRATRPRWCDPGRRRARAYSDHGRDRVRGRALRARDSAAARASGRRRLHPRARSATARPRPRGSSRARDRAPSPSCPSTPTSHTGELSPASPASSAASGLRGEVDRVGAPARRLQLASLVAWPARPRPRSAKDASGAAGWAARSARLGLAPEPEAADGEASRRAPPRSPHARGSEVVDLHLRCGDALRRRRGAAAASTPAARRPPRSWTDPPRSGSLPWTPSRRLGQAPTALSSFFPFARSRRLQLSTRSLSAIPLTRSAASRASKAHARRRDARGSGLRRGRGFRRGGTARGRRAVCRRRGRGWTTTKAEGRRLVDAAAGGGCSRARLDLRGLARGPSPPSPCGPRARRAQRSSIVVDLALRSPREVRAAQTNALARSDSSRCPGAFVPNSAGSYDR